MLICFFFCVCINFYRGRVIDEKKKYVEKFVDIDNNLYLF